MIVCSCNVLSDQDVRSAVEAERTRSTSQVYGCLDLSRHRLAPLRAISSRDQLQQRQTYSISLI
jgi:hypothetical protein